MAVSLLLVDDSEIVRLATRKVVTELFAGRAIEITEAVDGKLAVAAAAAKKFDVILLDLTMPEMDGFEVLEHLKEAKSTAKVIVMSADMQGGAVDRVLRLGAFTFLPKPVLGGALAKALTACGLL